MKIALVSDLHFGCKKSDKIFLENQINFFKNEFIPFLKKENINSFFILGDLFDNRTFLNSFIVYEVYKLFETFEQENLFIYIFPGNHDIYYKTSNEIHSLNFLKKFKNVKLIEEIELLEIENKKILIVPWQIDYEEFKYKVANKNIHCDVCLGHFDIIGFPFNNTQICDEGIETKVLVSNYTLTFSGHFHKRHTYKYNEQEIIMIGSPYQITRNDKNEERGFCILNLEDLKYEFVNSKNTIKFIDLKFPESFKEEFIKNNVIDVLVNYDGSFIDNDLKKYIEKIENFKPAYSPNIFINNSLFDKVSENYEIKTLSEMFEDYIVNLQIKNKNEIKEIINDLYIKTKGE